MLQGISASAGIAIGRVLIVAREERNLSKQVIDEAHVTDEINRFLQALERAKEQLKSLIDELERTGNVQEAGILEGQWFLLDDPELKQDVTGKIGGERVAAAWAVHEVFQQYALAFESIEDAYIKERIADMKDAESRLLDEITGATNTDLGALAEPAVILAHDLTPSMTAQMNKTMVLGFATEVGSQTSHTAIMARTFGIPAVVGVKDLLSAFEQGDTVVLDGEAGRIVKNPDGAQLQAYAQKRSEYADFRKKLDDIRHMPAKTKDGKTFDLYGNIGKPEEAEAVLKHGGEGVGLFRTEFLFMDRSEMPSEDEQYEAYRKALDTMEGRPVIIRTLDVGGDKEIPYLPIDKEFNPFLGWRAIRYCLADPVLFKIQLRALLRAAVHGDLRIMLPMISGLKEVEDARKLLDEAMQELAARGADFKREVPVGIMIEVPSAALISDRLARHVDFFSIGTNDLIQYTVAADRMNENVSYLYDAQHLAVLRLIDIVCTNAKKYGKHVGMCGEMAGDPQMAPLLVGLGVDEWSMSPSQIPLVKQAIAGLTESDCIRQVRELLN